MSVSSDDDSILSFDEDSTESIAMHAPACWDPGKAGNSSSDECEKEGNAITSPSLFNSFKSWINKQLQKRPQSKRRCELLEEEERAWLIDMNGGADMTMGYCGGFCEEPETEEDPDAPLPDVVRRRANYLMMYLMLIRNFVDKHCFYTGSSKGIWYFQRRCSD